MGRWLERLPHLDDRIFSLAEEKPGVLWLAGEHGLWKYENGRYTISERDHIMCHSRIYGLAYHRQKLWINSSDHGIGIIANDSLYSFPQHRANGFQFDGDTCWE